MLTIIALLTTLAAPDAGPPPISPEALQEANLELDALAAMANPPQRQIILSAILCEAHDRYRDINLAFASGRFSRSLVLAGQAAARDAEQARLGLEAHAALPLSCAEFSTARLVTCLDAAAPFWCLSDPHLAPTLRAAENLLQSWRTQPAQTSDAGVQP